MQAIQLQPMPLMVVMRKFPRNLLFYTCADIACLQAFAKRGREEVLEEHLQHARVCSGQQAQGHREHVRGDVLEADGDEGRDRGTRCPPFHQP